MANDENGIGLSSRGVDPIERIVERVVSGFLQALQNNVTNGIPEQQEGPITIK